MSESSELESYKGIAQEAVRSLQQLDQRKEAIPTGFQIASPALSSLWVSLSDVAILDQLIDNCSVSHPLGTAAWTLVEVSRSLQSYMLDHAMRPDRNSCLSPFRLL
jgi:hypothetical protein